MEGGASQGGMAGTASQGASLWWCVSAAGERSRKSVTSSGDPADVLLAVGRNTGSSGRR